jgi:hypothetical protein
MTDARFEEMPVWRRVAEAHEEVPSYWLIELLDALATERRISEWLANELAVELYDPTHPTAEELIADAEEATK